MSIETAKTDAFEMDYLRFGGGNRALVILPGLAIQSVLASASAIQAAYRALADEFTIFVLDRRKNLPESYSVREMAHDAYTALRWLGLDHICLFGASLGGMMALSLALEAPQFVSKLAVGSTAARISDEQFRHIEKWVELAEGGDAESLYLEFAEAIFPPSAYEQTRNLLIEAAKSVTEDDLRQFIIRARGIRGFDVLDQLDEIACPTLVLGAADDKVVGKDASLEIARRLDGRPDFQLHLYDGFGHAAYDLAPDYKERLLKFFTGKANAPW